MSFITKFLQMILIDKKDKIKKISASVVSNLGNIRNNHEDNYLLGKNQYIAESEQRKMINSFITNSCVFEGKKGIFAVCDGMGGHAAGEVASRIAVEWINNNYEMLLNDQLEQIEYHISLLNQELCKYAYSHKECKNMGSTLSALFITNNGLYCVNAGDSRIYEFSNNKLCQLTKDHTEGQRFLDWKLLNENEIKDLKTRKSLYRYLGYQGDLLPDVKRIEKKEANYLICSDGVTDILDDNMLENIFIEYKSCIDIGNKILQSALAMGAKCTDNVTAMVLNII